MSENVDHNPCAAVKGAYGFTGGLYCGRAMGHEGVHHDMVHGELWSQDKDQCIWRVRDPISQIVVRCKMNQSHEGDHEGHLGVRFTTQQAVDFEKELENEDYIVDTRAALKRALEEASLQLQRSLTRVAELKRVYDVEFAENDYIEHAIREAGMFTAAAQAMTDVLLK